MTFPEAGTPYVMQVSPLMSSFGAPCVAPPWASLTAVDLVRRRIVWTKPPGSIDRLAHCRCRSGWARRGRADRSRPGGDVVFIGYTLDNRLRAFGLRTAEELWTSPLLPAPAVATPITYTVGATQYVAIAAGGHSMYGGDRSDAVVAFRLKPRT